MGLTYSEQARVNMTEVCRNDGVGCDGTNDDSRAEYGECSCGCHADHAPSFLTNEDVHAYHVNAGVYRLATAEEMDNPTARRGSIKTWDGKTYVLREQYRV